MNSTYYISRYTFPICIGRNKQHFLYNTINGVIIKIAERPFTLIQSRKESNSPVYAQDFPEELFNIMLDRFLVVKKETDDESLNRIITENRLASTVAQDLVLTIAPTRDCNFACPYCYEQNKRAVYMSDETIDHLIAFVKNYKWCNNYRITWYGGEPLMALDVIRKITEKLKGVTDKRCVFTSMVSNCSLIDEEVLDFFKECGLDSIQISIDGAKEKHDTTRFDKRTRRGSYDILMEKIGLILRKTSNTCVNVRVNIDKRNLEDFFFVVDDLQKRYGNFTGRLFAYPGFIHTPDKTKNCWSCDTMQEKDKFEFYRTMYEKYKLPVCWKPRKKDKGCSATRMHEYVIGPSGDVYKCWNDLGIASRQCGVLTDIDALFSSPLLQKFVLWGNGAEDAACQKCGYLPICSTGCAWERIENKYNGGEYKLCDPASSPSAISECIERYLSEKAGNNTHTSALNA